MSCPMVLKRRKTIESQGEPMNSDNEWIVEHFEELVDTYGGSYIAVVDTTMPTINVSVSPNTLWPPNHKMVEITSIVDVRDNCDPDPTGVVSVTSNEPINAKGVGDGNTEPDWQIDDDGTIWLRAERDGNGDGRVYTITCTATDACGNSAIAIATVTVPLDQGKKGGNK